MSNVLQLYPQLRHCDDVKGLYLEEKLHLGPPCVYANFLTSLDGRIAVRVNHRSFVPDSLPNPNDLRLFFELQAQCDCLITHGGYLRSLASGELGDVLRLGGGRNHQDLCRWRADEGFAADPLIVVCSTSLNFQVPDFVEKERFWVATTEGHDQEKARRLRGSGIKVIVMNDGPWVKAGLLVKMLRREGKRTIYLSAGPKFFEGAINDRVLDLLYMTVSHQLIGHASIHTMVEGLFPSPPPCQMLQKRLIYDQDENLKQAQWYSKFACRY